MRIPTDELERAKQILFFEKFNCPGESWGEGGKDECYDKSIIVVGYRRPCRRVYNWDVDLVAAGNCLSSDLRRTPVFLARVPFGGMRKRLNLICRMIPAVW